MDVTPLVPEGVQIIHGYGDGGFRIAQVFHRGPVLVMPETTLPWSVVPASALDPLDLDALEPILAAEFRFDILLIGTGATQVFVPPAVRQRIRERGPVAEMMDSGAACRTFNLLLAEGRRVAAALLPVD
ncbi:MAG: Mth938-like domain-containing protein [Thalassobaculum sp.]|uniref:Mth938-like domain-containing protein n=1 Tax=Thalassobaculum sp. TaxID=2022740 RepID=UPI0032EEEAA7